jgi:hypothetical protein
MTMITPRRINLAINLFVGMSICLILAIAYWSIEYHTQKTTVEITGYEILDRDTGTVKTEKAAGLSVARVRDQILVSITLRDLPPATFRSDQVIVDCGGIEYTLHASTRQVHSPNFGTRVYNFSYMVPYISCQGPGKMITRLEITNRFNPFMIISPLVVESKSVNLYFVH